MRCRMKASTLATIPGDELHDKLRAIRASGGAVLLTGVDVFWLAPRHVAYNTLSICLQHCRSDVYRVRS